MNRAMYNMCITNRCDYTKQYEITFHGFNHRGTAKHKQ